MPEATLYECPRCTVQQVGPDIDDPRVCVCNRIAVGIDDEDVRLEKIGTVDVEEPVDGFERLGHSVETLQKGFGVLYENDTRHKTEGGIYIDWDSDTDPVPGEIHGIEETRHGPRYEICPATEWWHLERDVDEEGVPEDHVWHWEIVEVTERTRASVRLEEIREEQRG